MLLHRSEILLMPKHWQGRHVGNLRRHRWNDRVAILAAVMLFFQIVVGGFALGSAAAASPTLDIFGNPLCITGVTHSQTGDDTRDHSGLPDCCTPGCSMFAPVTSPDRDRYALVNPLDLREALPVATHVAISIHADDHDPASPRAPPSML